MGFSEGKPERQGLETSLPSFGSQLTYQQGFGKNWVYSIGLRYQRLESRLEHTYTIEDYQITLRDTLVAINQNLVTGGQTLTRGDIDLLVPAEVRIRHYNTVQLYQMPLTIGKWWQKGRWSTDVHLGTAVNVLTRQSGRTLYQGEVVYYQEASPEIIQSQWRIHALAASSLSYRLGKRLDLSTGIQIQRSLMNWSNESGIKMHPMIYSLELGCRYRL